MVQTGDIRRVQQGIYTIEDTPIDAEHILQLQYQKCIISHESALYHLGYSERVPENISVTVPRHFGTSRLNDKSLRIRYCKPELIYYGSEERLSNYGNRIVIYNLERTICDVIRHQKGMDIEIANKAIRKYCLENMNRLSLLMIYAKKMGISDKVRNKIEVLV